MADVWWREWGVGWETVWNEWEREGREYGESSMGVGRE